MTPESSILVATPLTLLVCYSSSLVPDTLSQTPMESQTLVAPTGAVSSTSTNVIYLIYADGDILFCMCLEFVNVVDDWDCIIECVSALSIMWKLALLCVFYKKPKAFRFMNFLADKIKFLGVVRDNRETEVKGFEMYKLAKKLKDMKKHMKNLNRKNGNVFNKVKAIKNELSRQKTKIECLKEGYFNSHFSNNIVKGRTSRSRIEMIQDDVRNVYQVEDASSLFLRKLDVEQAVDLIKPITNEEIKSVNGKDTCSAVKEFFTSEKLLGEFNTTIISLVPKTKSPARVTDYRPISYCNVVYKEISKVITNRLKTVLGELVDYNQSAFIPSRQISENILSALEFMKG
ncbi:RNA-directed DNA polymerase, eukaryota, reverse transcriptase zinc-binding domain protein [Tanacetum coccineum]